MTATLTQVLEHPSYIKFSRHLPRLITLIFLILIGIALARLVYLVIAPTPQIINTSVNTTAPVKRGPVVNWANKIAAQHIFGTEEKAVVEEKEPEKVVETKLNLKLRGVFAIDDKELGLALISNGNGPEEVYAVDDKISSNTKLAAVYADRVLLSVRGKYETLRLPDTKDTGVSFVAAPTARPSPSSNIPSKAGMADAVAEKSLGDYRKEFLRNPTTLARLVNVTQANDASGNAIGYKVSANGQHPAFDQLGVEDGDVITSINGIELDSTAKGMSAFQALRQSQSVTVQLLRNGQPTTLNLTF